MLESFTVETFSGRIGEPFHLRPEGSGAVETRLISATAWGREFVRQPKRIPFSLVFRGPRDPVLPQSTYPVEHAAIGSFALFLVPIGPDAEGMRYEAVFT